MQPTLQLEGIGTMPGPPARLFRGAEEPREANRTKTEATLEIISVIFELVVSIGDFWETNKGFRFA